MDSVKLMNSIDRTLTGNRVGNFFIPELHNEPHGQDAYELPSNLEEAVATHERNVTAHFDRAIALRNDLVRDGFMDDNRCVVVLCKAACCVCCAWLFGSRFYECCYYRLCRCSSSSTFSYSATYHRRLPFLRVSSLPPPPFLLPCLPSYLSLPAPTNGTRS